MKVSRTIMIELATPADVVLICSVCNTNYSDDTNHDEMERQEFVRIAFRGGYGSVFGDGNDVEIDVCQHCLLTKLGQFATISDPQDMKHYLGSEDA